MGKFKRQAYLLYKGDQWLSRDSMELCGVFTRKDELKKVARKVIAEEGEQHLIDAHDADIDFETETEVCRSILSELMSEYQTCGWSTRYTIETVTLNKAI